MTRHGHTEPIEGVADADADEHQPAQDERHAGHGGHSRWAMVACCIPMLLIAGLLVAQGAGAGFLLVAVGCTVMMGLMMVGMGGHGR